MGDNISANTLFHFTNSLDKIESILLNEFYPRYCLEDHRMFCDQESVLYSYFERAIPMVCFCDIPLSQISKHINVYGGYAVGLSKEWGESQKISPVMYASPTSSSTVAIRESFSQLLQNLDSDAVERGGVYKAISRIGFLLDSFITYTKPYKGKVFRNDMLSDEEVVFYDEREWRFVPDPEQRTSAGLPLSLSKDQFLDTKQMADANATISSRFKLSFEPKDIKYIIVKYDSEILPMIDKVTHIKGPKYSYNDVRLLTTRIISMDQILSDF